MIGKDAGVKGGGGGGLSLCQSLVSYLRFWHGRPCREVLIVKWLGL